MTKRKSTRGGSRAGAGRKPADASGAKVKRTIWLTPAEVAHCVALAGGVGPAVRRLIAESMGQGP